MLLAVQILEGLKNMRNQLCDRFYLRALSFLCTSFLIALIFNYFISSSIRFSQRFSCELAKVLPSTPTEGCIDVQISVDRKLLRKAEN